MRFTVLDLENNQPTGKITQLGALVYDTDQGIIATFNEYIDPGEPVNWDFMLKPINCTLEELLAPGFRAAWEANARPTEEVLREFWEWHKKSQAGKRILQWGNGDTAELLAESQGLGYPPHLKVSNLKMIYQFLWQPAARLEKQSGLGTACKMLRVDPPNPPHDAFNDAKATGELFLEMFRQVKGVSELLKL